MSYDTLDLMGDSTRRTILELLRDRPRSVAAVADELPVSRPAVSKHLRLMLDAGLVDVTQVGTRRIYRIRPEGFAEVVRYWDGFWTGVLGRFKEHAERGLD
jgi:predicted transcriptional regulator